MMSDVGDTAAPETPVAAPIATPEPDSTAEQVPTPEEGESPEAKPERTFTQKELDEVVQKRLAKESRRAEKLAEARLRAEYAERERDALKAQINPPAAQPSGEPKLEDYQDWDTFDKARLKWYGEQIVGSIRKEREAQQQERQREQTKTAIAPKVDAARTKYEDFDDVALSVSFPESAAPAQAAMLHSKITGELYYYLGSNPAEAEAISRLPPIEQVYAIRDLETKLTAPPSPTRAPPPIVPNTGKSPVAKSYSDMNYDEFVAARRKEIAAKRR